MSGLEIAGIVLGSIPLIISAVEHYSDAMSAITRAREYKIELRKIKHDLDAEYTIFLDTLERLLTGLVLPKQFEQQVLENPSSINWQEYDLRLQLEMRLGRSYPVFVSSMNEMNEVVQEFVKQLDLDKDGRPRWTDRTGLRLLSKTAQFAVRRKAFDDLVGRLQKHNRHLEKFTNRSVEFEQLRKRKTRSATIRKSTQNAKSVYNAIEMSLGCGCKGVKGHLALLGISTSSTSQKEGGESREFQLILSRSILISSEAGKFYKTWQEMILKAIPSTEEKPQVAPVNVAEVTSNSVTSQTKRSRFFKRISRLVPVIAPSSSYKQPKQISTVATKPSNSNTYQPSAKETRISHLCNIVSASLPIAESGSARYITDGNQKFALHQYAHPISQDFYGYWRPFTLRETLDRSDANRSSPTPWERITLASTVASATLWLYDSPWLKTTWDGNDVFFVKRTWQRPYGEAFIAKTMLGPEKGVASSPSSIINETLLALAIVLIEIILGPLEKLQTPEDLRAGIYASLVTVSRLVANNDILVAYGPKYHLAVARCIELAKTTKIWDETIQQELYEGVISVLEDQAGLRYSPS